MDNKEINILDYFYLLYKARKYIFWNFVIVCFLAGIVSLFLPKYYQSIALLLPPSETSEDFGFSEALSMLPVNIRLGGKGSPSDIFIGIIKSQTIANSILDKFNLMSEYGTDNRDSALETLKSLTSITTTKEGLIKIAVEDRDNERSAAITNMYWTMLDSINKQINQGSAQERGGFLKQQMRENDLALQEAESGLKEYQMKTKAVSPYQQQRVVLSVTAELEMDIMERQRLLKEYRLKSFSDDNPLVQELLKTIKVREEQLHNMRFGAPEDERESLFTPLQELPDLVLTYAKLSRRVEILGQLGQLLSQQYEEARIQQANPTSTVTVLDQATPPVKKSRPKRKLIVVVAGAASLFFSIVTIISIEFFNRLTELSPENREKAQRLARFLRINT